jgi:5-methylthioadenosine/S-adenosylhomocysteine deaminase
VVMADGTGPHWLPAHNRLSATVYSGRAADVRLTMVDGHILYRDGEYLSLDAERIRHEVNAVTERLFGFVSSP